MRLLNQDEWLEANGYGRSEPATVEAELEYQLYSARFCLAARLQDIADDKLAGADELIPYYVDRIGACRVALAALYTRGD